MAKVTEAYFAQKNGLLFICDFSPPRAGNVSLLEPARYLDVQFISMAYNPSRSVRVDSAMSAYAVKKHTGKDVVFNLATRDMNKLALQSHLLGAQILGLENVVVVKGDDFTDKERTMIKEVNDIRPTELISAVTRMNEGLDFKGLKLRAPTSFCVGATIDLSKDIEGQAHLTQRKIAAGASFFITQSIYDVDCISRFCEAYRSLSGGEIHTPVFYGLQILHREALVFGNVPAKLTKELEQGRHGTDIALELLHQFANSGVRGIYLIPPILRAGIRDYEATQRVIEAFKHDHRY